MTTGMKPYLELPHLLSLSWLAYPIVSLLFVAFRLQLSLKSSEDAIATAKSDLLASCRAAERAATSAASMPRYMAIATNKQFADAVNGSINGAREVLTLSLTAMEAVINFVVDIYRSSFLCFLELVVRSGLEILIQAVQELNAVVNNVAGSLRTSIQNDIANANNVIQGAINAINKVNPFTKITPPQITVPSLDALQNVTLPSSFQDALVQLNNTIPSVADLKQKVTDILDQPFELVKADINDTFSNIPHFDESLFPVPEQNTVTFCDQIDLSVIDDLSKELVKMAEIGLVIIIVTALVLIGLHCLLIWFRWWRLKRHLEFTRQAWMTDPTIYHNNPTSRIPEITLSDHNLMLLQSNMHHPLITRILHTLAAKLHLTPAQHSNLRWFFHYIFHPPALACFLIGFLGLLSVELQLLALGPLGATFSKQVVTATTDFSNTIATAMNTTMFNQSATYANDVNTRVNAVQTTINDGIFGWVNDTTTTLNNTVNAFYTNVQNAVSTLFNGTILEAPAQEFIKCIIGSKVDAIEKTLTFLHDNLHVNMPLVNESVLVLSPHSINEVTQPIARAAVGSGQSNDGGVVGKIIRTYEKSLKKERVMFSIFILLWGVVVLTAVCILLWSTFGRQWLDNRSRRKYQREQKSGIDGLIIPFKQGLPSAEQKGRTSSSSSHSSLPQLRTSPFRPFATFNNNGNRAATPVDSSQRGFTPTHPRFKSDETLVVSSDEEKDVFFGGVKGSVQPRPLTAIDKLKAIGKKTFGRERPQPTGTLDHMDEKRPQESSDVGQSRELAWIGHVRSKLVKSLSTAQSEGHVSLPPKLNEKTEEGPIVPPPSSTGGLKSRWSNDTATPTTAEIDSWRVTNSSRRGPPLPLTPPAFTPLRQLKSIPLLPEDDQHAEESRSPTKPTIAPVPLYHSFGAPKASQRPSRAAPQPPIFNWTTRSGFPPPPESNKRTRKPLPKVSTSLLSSAFSDDSVSSTNPFASGTATPATPAFADRSRSRSPKRVKQRNDRDREQDASITPVTQFLTGTHARKSSEMNPFVTPFDDEHRVTIEMENPARKSMATNPFASAGVAL